MSTACGRHRESDRSRQLRSLVTCGSLTGRRATWTRVPDRFSELLMATGIYSMPSASTSSRRYRGVHLGVSVKHSLEQLLNATARDRAPDSK